MFSSVQDGICALGKAHMRSIPSLRCFSNVAFEPAPMFVWLTTALSRPFKEDGKNKINEAFKNEIISLKFLFWCVLPVGDKTPTYLPVGERPGSWTEHILKMEILLWEGKLL